MTIQTVQEVSVRMGLESAWGVIPANPQLKEIEKVSWAVNLMRDPYVSNRIRSDRQIADVGFGARRSEGDYQDELSLHDHDVLLSCALCGTWTAGAVSNATFAADGTAHRYTRTAGSWVADGITTGSTVVIAGFDTAANNGPKTVVSVDDTHLTVAEDLVDETQKAGSATVEGFTLKNAKVDQSFFAEVWKPEFSSDSYERFTGLKVNSAAISLPPSGIATVRYSLMGRDMALADTPLDGSVDAPADGDLIVASNGACFVNGQQSAVVTQLDINIANNMQAPDAVGLKHKAALLLGKSTITGSFTAMVEDNALAGYYSAGQTISLGLRLDGGYSADFLSFFLPRLYITKCSQSVSGDGALMVSCEFQATLSRAHGAAIIAQKSYA